ncbi:Oxo-4-hydroxy-4-carboxy-5-ureidoimidazoline decarboxylase [Ampelomyces quisqualis]|uniref:Oxo-4-hydroxy-4-carboxy-5-ureidoimidazoline decarboxylase n=1 Tax=Ampelomyces quisqualis TaxID=50730 RepID=A0A6A5R3K0_AMPQU|nr:Oxo-4-hydroxy-4-carboxy-5-ureidoimidazoline decarboxylase [Ampelomyces quisqualis]
MAALPPISSLPHAPAPTLISVLDLLFEPSPPLHALALPVLRSTTFPSYDVLIVAVRGQLSALAASAQREDVETLSNILCSHPRLGDKQVDSEQSRQEQAQLHHGEHGHEDDLSSLNREYEEKFPGLRYVPCAT